MTGVTGLVGQYLMKDLVLKGQRLAVVARSSKKLNAQDRIEIIFRRWESELNQKLPRPVVFEGNVCEENLGLSEKSVKWVAEHCDRVIHNAAILQFQAFSREHEPWVTNLGGTKNILNLIRKIDVSELHYVSTAYVCGFRDGVVYENELDVGQEFRNDYERSKFEAEQLVHEFKRESDTSVTIYRPAVIAGDSKTGFTSTYHGLFLYLRLIGTVLPTLERNAEGLIETPIKLPVNGDEPRNVVPVDWVSEVIAHLVCTPEAHGEIFHLSPDKTITCRLMVDACSDYYKTTGVIFTGPLSERPKDDNPFQQMAYEYVQVYQEYETTDPHFDTTHLKKFAGHIECPEIDSEMIIRFLRFGEQDKWGKIRPKKPQSVFSVDQHSASLHSAANKVLNGDIPDASVGIDLFGPDGGQWYFNYESDAPEIKIGVPRNGVVVSVNTEEIPSADEADDDSLVEFWGEVFQSQLVALPSDS